MGRGHLRVPAQYSTDQPGLRNVRIYGCIGSAPLGGLVHILFVCTGNICRSPIAERIAIAYGTEFGIPDLKVSSAGTRAVIGHPVHHFAASVIEELGGDSAAFAARQLTLKIASESDLILTMTRGHREAVLELAPRMLQRTFTLGEAARLVSERDVKTIEDLADRRGCIASSRIPEIRDPIGQSFEIFRTTGSEIAALLPSVIRLL